MEPAPETIEAAEERVVRRRIRAYIIVAVAVAAMLAYIGWRSTVHVDGKVPGTDTTGTAQ